MLTHSLAPASLRSRALDAALVVCIWTAFGILASAHFFLGEEARSGAASFRDVAAHVLIFYWAWAAVTPLALLALRAVVDPHAPPRRRWSIAIGAATAIVVAHAIIYLAVVRLVGLTPMTPIGAPELGDYAMRHGGGDAATIAVIAAVYLLLDARQRAHEREIAATALRASLSSAELELLRWQLQPHFLHNALNTISTLVLRGDGPRAEEAIEHIARYLRAAVAQRADALVTVEEEVCGVRQYFAIEQLRFDDLATLDVRIEPEAAHVRIPALLLQPLVENAIRHGRSAGGVTTVGVRVSASHGRLAMRVTDSGAAVARPEGEQAAAAAASTGFGLRYVRERLQHFYGADAGVRVDVSSMGAVATVELPLAANPRPAVR